ncbi:hypothetical protein [Nocardiopsis tropica]|uniref:Transmembrane protein n=1 Tax=Nocardiopsis tropica TaxID=109330 RepID=A0ABU7L0T6_9ACTN|nr:hypothetical protein [Nocardiopsis umidischolae]MEE2055145.1 hypothetical protein [Nocardiopsis umidischolae]
MSTPPQQLPLLNQAVASWFRMEALIGTPLAEQAWKEHWALVLRLRRSYVLFCLGTGLFAAGAAAVSVTLLGPVWEQGQGFPLSVLPFVFTPVILGPVWKRRTAGTVAPFLGQRRHVWPRWLFGLVFPVVLILGVFVPWSPTWTVVAGVLCAAPWWLSAALEQRRPVPSYPAAWLNA